MTLVEDFAATYGRPPLIAASAPGRVNLIGEHTDYNGGAVLPAALARRIQVALAPNTSDQVVIKSTRFDAKIERPVGDPKRGDWTDYAMGALWKADALGWLSGGVSLYIESDIPDGAGVSSSAALITAILRAAAIVAQVATTPVEIAKHARSVENDYIGMPCGIMDQMAVGLADFGKALALDTSDLSFDVLDIPGDWSFVVIHSGVRRELADGRYKARFEECQQASQALATRELCRLDQSQIAAMNSLPDPLLKRTRHVLTEHKRTVEATAAMKAGAFETFGRLMNESHQSYSQDFEASTPVIDALVQEALTLGAAGARLTGGGFGGCIVALLKTDQVEAWSQALLDRNPNAWRV